MTIRKKSGFTLVEVVVSFVILSLLAVMVLATIASSYLASTQLKDLSNTYYGGQNEVETQLDELRTHLRVKFRLQNEINATAEAALDPTLRSQLRAEEDWLLNQGYTSAREVNLFGKSVELYQFTTEYNYANNKKVTVYAGSVNAETLDRQVPILDSVTITAGTNTAELYNSEGTTINVSEEYNDKNAGLVFRTYYQWYIGTSNFHTAPFTDGTHYEDATQYGGTIYSAYPNDFNLLVGETQSAITIKEEYLGHILICVATPLSKNGAMGKSMISNHLYLSNLPNLSDGDYLMLIDPSMETLVYTGDEEKVVTSVSSRRPAGPGLTGTAVLSLHGDATGDGAYSRYLHFTDETSMTGSNLHGEDDVVVMVVARNNGIFDKDFISATSADGIKQVGFQTNDYSEGSGNWKILKASLGNNCTSFTVGNAEVDVAELLIISGAESDEINQVMEYLTEKYGMED